MMAETETALSLMKMALALLDSAGDHDAAASVQHAISIADHEPIPTTIEEADALLDTPAAQALLNRIPVK